MEITNQARRRHLLAGFAGGLFGGLCLPQRAAATTFPYAVLELPEADRHPNAFLTLSSATLGMDGLREAAQQRVLPALADAQIKRASGPVFGAIQLWLELDRQDMASYGLEIDGALAVLARATGAIVVPMPGLHRLNAWVLQRPHTDDAIEVNATRLALPGNDDASMFALVRTVYASAPPQWANQSSFTMLLESDNLLGVPFVQRCGELLRAVEALPARDLQIQLGRLGAPMQPVPDIYVSLRDE